MSAYVRFITFFSELFMKPQNLLISSVFVLCQSFVASHAIAEDDSNLSTSVEIEETLPAPATVSGKIPKLNIHWDCGDCEVNEKVIPLIEQTYAAEASRNNHSLSEEDIADVAIIDFRQRNPAVRVMFGFMAGKDRLGIKINYRGKEFVANDYSANVIFGMNSLCESVAKATYKQIAESGN
jgi:hypothetical protein